MAYVANRLDLLWALGVDLEGERLDGTTSALKVLASEEHLLELWVGLTNIAELVVPGVDGGVGEPDSRVASLIWHLFTLLGNRLVLEWRRIAPAGGLCAGEVLSLLGLAGLGGVNGRCVSGVRHDWRDVAVVVKEGRKEGRKG